MPYRGRSFNSKLTALREKPRQPRAIENLWEMSITDLATPSSRKKSIDSYKTWRKINFWRARRSLVATMADVSRRLLMLRWIIMKILMMRLSKVERICWTRMWWVGVSRETKNWLLWIKAARQIMKNLFLVPRILLRSLETVLGKWVRLWRVWAVRVKFKGLWNPLISILKAASSSSFQKLIWITCAPRQKLEKIPAFCISHHLAVLGLAEKD